MTDEQGPIRRSDRRADIAGLVCAVALLGATYLFGLADMGFPGSLVLAVVAAVVTAAVMWWVRRLGR